VADGSSEGASSRTTGRTSGRTSGRIEVVGRVSGRRRWSDQQKLGILEAAFGRGGTVRAAINAHEVTTGLLYTWRRLFLAGKLGTGAVTALPSFARVEVPDVPPPVALTMLGEVTAPAVPVPSTGVIAIELPSGVRVRLEGSVDADTLARTLAALG